MEKNKEDESKRREKGRDRVETTEDIRKKERGKQTEDNRRKKIFQMWKFWAYCPSLQKWKGTGISTDALKQI